MAGGFGFEKMPQSPSPDPREVGRELRQKGRGGYGGGMQGGPASPAGTPEEVDPSHDPQRQLGAVYMGGRGQMGTGSAPPGQPDYTEDDDVPASMTAAVGEALTRMGNGVMRAGEQHPLRTKRRREQLLQLGASQLEVDLLSRSGGL